jgi:hypothetical protein
MNEANDSQLKGQLSRQRAWVVGGAIAVIAGLIAEVVLAVVFHQNEPFWEKWGTVLATVLIAVGVLVETVFGHKGDATSDTLQKLADQRTAEANKRAEEAKERTVQAELQLAKLWERVVPRVVTPEMREKLKGLQGLVARIAVTWQRSAEPANFGGHVALALKKLPSLSVNCPPSAPGDWALGIFVVYPAGMDELRRKAIADVLACIGANKETSGPRPWAIDEDFNSESVVIFVGDNPIMYAAPE